MHELDSIIKIIEIIQIIILFVCLSNADEILLLILSAIYRGNRDFNGSVKTISMLCWHEFNVIYLELEKKNADFVLEHCGE